MRIKTLTITVSLALFLLTMPQISLAQKDGEAQAVFFDANNRPTLKFTNKYVKAQDCGTFVSYTLMNDNREEAIAVRVNHLHWSGIGFKPSLKETGWLYITPSRIIFRVEEGDESHSFDIPRTDLKDSPVRELYGRYVGIQVFLKEKLPASNSDVQKFVFFVFGVGEHCIYMNWGPYRHFIQRAITDFTGTLAEFKRVADSLKQSGKIEQAPAYVLPPGNSARMAAPSGDAVPLGSQTPPPN
jgi:hypothetical protein